MSKKRKIDEIGKNTPPSNDLSITSSSTSRSEESSQPLDCFFKHLNSMITLGDVNLITQALILTATAISRYDNCSEEEALARLTEPYMHEAAQTSIAASTVGTISVQTAEEVVTTGSNSPVSETEEH